MDNLLAARATMTLSFIFHIIFACIGMTMPFLMVVSHWLWLKKGDDVYLRLTKAWSKGVAIFFAIGAVSGTALSFELGLLWPGFMKHAGAIIGMPFSWEGSAFFVESVCIGLFLYGWNRLNKWVHWTSGLLVGISGLTSGVFVVSANAWMNAPTGFDWVNGHAINIDPWAAMFNSAMTSETTHMSFAAFEATAFAVAGIHALMLLRGRNFQIHKVALKIALSFAAVAALIQPLSGDFTAKDVARRQPIKLAAMEGLFDTKTGAGLTIGGIPDTKSQTTPYGIQIPKALSFLAYGDFDAEVKGLKEFPPENLPPVLYVHLAFQIMVGCGSLLALVGIIFLITRIKWKDFVFNRKYLWLVVICTPLGFLAVETGWIVTEVGRQPWIIYEILKTKDSVTPVPGQIFHFLSFLLIYAILSIVGYWLMLRQIKALHKEEESLLGGGNL
ncbi:MAG: cytochrome ubiquinol oxidase subunit I [Syntrophothermus sp.]